MAKGICFYNILGHDVRAMRNSGWQLLTLRGTQWAAGAKITVTPSPELQIEDLELSDSWRWLKTDTTFALQNDDQILWQYNFNTSKGKPFFHPVATPDGVTITALSPQDHPWHLGLWHSWKFINGLNYWEYKPDRKWEYAGVTEVRDIKFDEKPGHKASISLQLEYHPEDSLGIMTESRKHRDWKLHRRATPIR